MFNNSGINPEALRYNFQGEWSADKVYRKNDTVRIRGCTYYCKTNKMAKNNWYGYEFHPTKSYNVDNEYWAVMTANQIWRGAWSANDIYQPGDIVKYRGDWYICHKGSSNKNNNPVWKNGEANDSWMMVMAADNTHEKRYRVSTFWNRNPIGWQRNSGSVGGIGDSQPTRPVNQMGAINWQGQPVLLGGRTTSYGFGAYYNYDWNVTRSAVASNGGSNHSLAIVNMWDMSTYHGVHRHSNNSAITSITNDQECLQFVSCGANSMYLLSDGSVWVTGYNGHGQMGDNTTTDYNYYGLTYRAGQDRNRWWDTASNNPLYNVHAVKLAITGQPEFSNSSTMMVLDISGNVWTWGYNGNGQCAVGHSTSNTVRLPQKIENKYFDNQPIVDIFTTAQGSDATLYALAANGELYGWGYNGNGQVGNGDFRHQWRPQRVKYDWSKFGGIKKFISQGYTAYSGVYVLCNDGSMHAWGYIMGDSQGWHGMDRSASVCTPRHANIAHWEAQKSMGSSRAMDTYTIGDNVEDFWVVGARYKTIIMKEKTTGDLYSNGYQADHSSVYPHPQVGANNGDHEFVNWHSKWPSRIMVGDLKNVTHVARSHTGGTRSLYFLNDDHRVFQTGYRGHWNAGDGYDEHADDAIDSSNRWSLLSEFNGAHNSPRMLKGQNIAGNIIDQATSQSQYFGLTTDGRVMKIGSEEPYYSNTSIRRHYNDNADDYVKGHSATCDGMV